MRIVQTFWTAGRDPLKYSFGWTHPEYNLMSWALSCLSLREHYDEVALYTDQEGYDVLINKLHLPYTEVNVVYDKNLCLPHHWAYDAFILSAYHVPRLTSCPLCLQHRWQERRLR